MGLYLPKTHNSIFTASSNVFAHLSDLDVTHIDVVTAQPVTGFFAADYKKVPRAFLLKTLTFNEVNR